MKKILFIFSIFIIILLFTINKFDFNQDANLKKIKFASWGSQTETIILNQAIKEFENKNSDIKIEFIHIPQNYFQKLHLLFASGLEPDVVFINNQYIQLYIKSGLLEDLTPYFSSKEELFYKQALNCFKSDGKLYAIPRDLSNLVIYYNKDLFNKRNIKSAQFKNIYHLAEITKELTSENNFGINTEDNPLFWLYYLASNGGGALSDDKKNIIINNKESIQALKLYSDLIHKYKSAPKPSDIGSMTTAQMFINGKIAMYLGGRWMFPKFKETINFNWDITEFPVADGNNVYIDASGWALSKQSKNKEEAIKFIEYLSSQEVIDKFTESGLIIPARKDSSNKYFSNAKNNTNHNEYIFIKTIEKTKPTPVNENYSKINDILKEKALEMINGEKNPEDIFDNKTVKELENLL